MGRGLGGLRIGGDGGMGRGRGGVLRAVGGQFCRRGSQPPYHLRFSKLRMTRTSLLLPLDFYFAPEEMMFSKEVGEQNPSESAVIALLLIWKTAQAVILLCQLVHNVEIKK